MTKPPCSPKGIIDEAEPEFFRDWLQDLACNHLINTIHSQHTASGPARSRNHLCRFERRDVPLVDWRSSSRSSDGFRLMCYEAAGHMLISAALEGICAHP